MNHLLEMGMAGGSLAEADPVTRLLQLQLQADILTMQLLVSQHTSH